MQGFPFLVIWYRESASETADSGGRVVVGAVGVTEDFLYINHRCPPHQLHLPPKMRFGDPSSPLHGNAGNSAKVSQSFLSGDTFFIEAPPNVLSTKRII